MGIISMQWRPIARAAITSGSIMACSDALCQTIISKSAASRDAASKLKSSRQSEPFKLDIGQSARFGLVGLTLHGPWFYYGFRWLDNTFGTTTTLKTAVTKTLAGQVLLFPAYIVGFYTYLGFLEGLKSNEIGDKLRATVPATFVTGSVFWPLANVFNFMFIKPSGRVVYVNIAGLFWNSYLSWENSTKGRVGLQALDD